MPSERSRPSRPSRRRSSKRGADLRRRSIATSAQIQLYDSARRQVVPFEPLGPGRIGMYNCGPTVYDWQHIGNLYAYFVADIWRRTFEYLGYDVRQVMNITDVGHIVGDVDEGDDKMAVGAKREGKDPQALATMYTDQFFVDRRKLNILDPHVICKATEHIEPMLRLIQTLIDKGHAYVTPNGVYYDITTFPGYGTRLNAELPEERKAGARVEIDPHKRDPHDFALWRSAKPGDLQQWDSPWGKGNPGWHIECSAMSMQYLGETFDLHTGGEDHLFPHHECEIAQSEGATGKQFVRYWMHNRFLRLDSAKMAKSAGGFYRLDDIESWGFDPLAFRLLALGTSYRKGLDFTREGLAAAQARLERWRSLVAEAKQSTPEVHVAPAPGPRIDSFRDALADDFNTPKALAVAEDAAAMLTSPRADDRALALGELFDMDRVLGLGLEEWSRSASSVDPDAQRLLDERARTRAAGDYKRSDELRDELRTRGYLVKDTKDGQRWERIRTEKNDT